MTVRTYLPRSIKPSGAALLYGVGNSNSYYKWGAANKNAVEMRLESGATSGDSRGEYLRMKFSGAGGGEVMRVFAQASAAAVAVTATVNAIHASLSVDAACGVSGAGNAIRATLGAAAATRSLGGTLAALQLDSDIGTGNTLPDSASFIRVTNTGAVALAKLFSLPAAANGTMVAAHVTDGPTHSIRCDIGGTAVYLLATTTVTNRS